MDTLFVYDPEMSRYQLHDAHPFKPIRLELTRSLLRESGLLAETQEIAVEPLAEEALLRVHDRAYVDAVKASSAGSSPPDAYSYGLGTGDNPIFPGMHEAVLGVCAATVTAVELVASGRCLRAANFGGGLHHALHDRASGFCIYNDLALAIDHAVTDHDLRVAYVDVDAHHGDGVQWLFYEHPRVMTISLHESGQYLFPGTGYTYEVGRGDGRGLSVNVPLEPFTEDESFLDAFELVVPRALQVFRPDLIVLQAGADMHRYDPLADLALSLTAMRHSYQRVKELADQLCGGRLVVTGGGGYDPYRTVPRAWSQLWSCLVGQPLPDPLPESWRQRWLREIGEVLPGTPFDDMSDWQPIARRDSIDSHNRSVARRLLETLERIWQERSFEEGDPSLSS